MHINVSKYIRNVYTTTLHQPEDGFWFPWVSWDTCTATCGGGTQQRSRDCRAGKYGGENCTGDRWQERECNQHPCPSRSFVLSALTYCLPSAEICRPLLLNVLTFSVFPIVVSMYPYVLRTYQLNFILPVAESINI